MKEKLNFIIMEDIKDKQDKNCYLDKRDMNWCFIFGI